MSLAINAVKLVDRAYWNGNPDWDHDQTLHHVAGRDNEAERIVRVVVLRGDGFITPEQVGQYLEDRFRSFRELEARACPPADGLPPEVVLEILPSDLVPAH
jgi:hypothetical protein